MDEKKCNLLMLDSAKGGSLSVHRLESDELDLETSIHYDKLWITNANYRRSSKGSVRLHTSLRIVEKNLESHRRRREES
jgi:exonuclease VII small subunit